MRSLWWLGLNVIGWFSTSFNSETDFPMPQQPAVKDLVLPTEIPFEDQRSYSPSYCPQELLKLNGVSPYPKIVQANFQGPFQSPSSLWGGGADWGHAVSMWQSTFCLPILLPLLFLALRCEAQKPSLATSWRPNCISEPAFRGTVPMTLNCVLHRN